MKIIIIGSVAAGTSVAAKARRNQENVEITIYEKDSDISYSGCGLPYYIGEDYIKRDNLTPRTPSWFKKRFNIDINTQHEVIDINPSTQTLTIRNLATGDLFQDKYDKLVLATGATPFIPPIKNLNQKHVFSLRNVHQADSILNFISNHAPKHAAIIGSGYIGLEMAENLQNRGLKVSIIEMEALPMPALDPDVSVHILKELKNKKIEFYGNETADSILHFNENKFVELKSGKQIKADLVIVSTGVKPQTELAKNINLQTSVHGAIRVNEHMQTSIDNIYAVGDCAVAYSRIDFEPVWVPLGSTANKMGRICGDHITGGSLKFEGILGTGIFKVFDLSVATTGFTEEEARNKGYNIAVHHNFKPNQTEYFASSSEMMIKMIADKDTGKILGAQIIGKNGVDKRIDVIATAITFGATAEQLFHLDLAYAPPFSTTKDPVHYSGMVLNNAVKNSNPIITPYELLKNRQDYQVVDVRSSKQYNDGHIEGAINIPLPELREKYNQIEKHAKVVVHCNKGVTGNAAQNLLQNLGFRQVFNLSGGYKNYKLYLMAKS
ncbi:FAD-dependent oxidoreductase [Aureibacter tunicatorum]|uniref:NADPH-dependent 2,4-dienoyl-CoA reductase/sulfur reductase-like enzyme/rhodanese-related sulfurtransferase n=1 Tax=Aureibacter tunicatorum TaxID=866807 RepID=A0AAE3XSM8_9BACT|nr:FAD-dependent oxidoreductase [Aureibacter tunicatorum]MDR6241289.1 NADPH-dependent 2,4-dienoyl-CoA reductase/sulfur reductase-like enzyme/rhodanese-related sulfurtransferase [Aureibacter tunicatorum]BDD03549.1 CoA-disulfide reductase [Aureibacter tunicatorum]